MKDYTFAQRVISLGSVCMGINHVFVRVYMTNSLTAVRHGKIRV